MRSIAALPIVLLLAACGRSEKSASPPPTPESTPIADTAVVPSLSGGESTLQKSAELAPTKGNTAKGKVLFSKLPDGRVKVVADFEGLTPGKHGFHIHENGDCGAPDASSAGEHFAPKGQPHGGPEAEHRHAGDLGNVEADANGKAHYERVDARIELEGSGSVVGRAVIVHEKVDDLGSQPSGAAGARVACGVIRP